MIQFSVGCTWDVKLLEAIAVVNAQQRGTRIVSELYGSLPSSVSGIQSARPDFRIPRIDMDLFKKYLAHAHELGVQFNYTVNSPLTLPVSDYHNNLRKMKDMLLWLRDAGVDVFTVANFLLLEIVKETLADVVVELSSVSHSCSLAQLPIYNKHGISLICMDVVRNRDISFLKNFVRKGKELNIEIKLLANEMCSFAGAPCLGILQQDCVAHSSLGGNPEKLFDAWPFNRCAESRKNNPAAWLKSRFILPQWVSTYQQETQISRYKITGRTCNTDWLISVVNSYMNASFEGDIRYLWIDPGVHNFQDSFENTKLLEAKFLEEKKFMQKWFNEPDFRCSDCCGDTCHYCEQF